MKTSRSTLRGLTLVEVLAALVLLGGVVTVSVVSLSTSVESLRAGAIELEAERIAGELIAEWQIRNRDASTPAAGQIAGAAGWSWERRAIPTTGVEDLPLRQAELTLSYTGAGTTWQRRFVWWVSNEKS